MSKTEQNNLQNQELVTNPRDFRAGNFIKFINKKFGIPRQSEIMSELIEAVYSPMRKDLNIGEKDEKGKNSKIALSEICTDDVFNQEKFDNLVLKRIAKFNQEKNYECLNTSKQDLTTPILQNSKLQSNSQILEKGENNLQILETEKTREKTTTKMLEELKNHNFGSIDKTQIVKFLDFLENIVNFEIQFVNGRITINPLGIDNLDLDDNVLSGFNQEEQDFYRLMADFIKAKNFERQVLDKITQLKKSPEFSLAKRYSYETEDSNFQFLAPKINGIIKDSKLQDKFIEIINEKAKENSAEEFDINYLLRATSGYRLAEYLFTTHNNGFEIFDLNNLSLKNVLINQKKL